MTDMEKVISALECISNGAKQPCRDCEYSKREEWCIAECAKDALSLLKAQEPRLLTLEEVKEAAEQEKPMYVHEAKFPESTRWLIPKNAGHYGFEERGSGCQFKYYDYLSKQIGGFCCWTAEPTDEQKETVKWDA